MYTGGSSAEHLIGSTDDKGSWLDGLLLRRLRALVEGSRGSRHAGGAHSRHRACGIGAGDVCPPLAGKATSGFSHGNKSRLLVLDGPVSRLLEGVIAGDHAGAPPLTGPQVCAHSPPCNLLDASIRFHPRTSFGSYQIRTAAHEMQTYFPIILELAILAAWINY